MLDYVMQNMMIFYALDFLIFLYREAEICFDFFQLKESVLIFFMILLNSLMAFLIINEYHL